VIFKVKIVLKKANKKEYIALFALNLVAFSIGMQPKQQKKQSVVIKYIKAPFKLIRKELL